MSDFELNIFVIEIFLFILTHSTIVSFIQKLFFYILLAVFIKSLDDPSI